MQAQQLLNNRYRVDGLLGNGGMALVYVGTDTLLRRRVAIKVLRDQYASDDDFVKRFSYEAQSAAKLSHPNIVNIYDFGVENDAYYIVMELVDGSTLGELLQEERVLPEGVAVDYAIQIASGLAYAHRQGLLHRDVKPANILVTKDDVVKLSDFGIARAVSEHTLGVTQPGMVMGSVAYISPEQAQNHELDERSDLYSVGVVLYQMLVGALPFSGDTPVAVAIKHVSQAPPVIDPAVTGVSPAVAAIVARLLRKSPQDRFSSATELASALREARERPLIVGPVPDPSIVPGRPVPPSQPPPRRSVAPDRPENRISTAVDEDDVAPRRDIRWIAMPLLLVAAIVIGFFVLRGFGPKPDIAVPNLQGMSATVAQQRLFALGLKAAVNQEPSETVPQDHVTRQDPPPGTKLARDAQVTLFVSDGLPKVAVPDVRQYSAADAQRTLANVKLRAKVTGVWSSKPTGEVIDINPPPGSQVRENTTIALTVSKGVKPIQVPSLINLSVDDARRKLAALGLTLTVGQSTESDAIPANAIASQSPDPGQTVAPNSTVTVVVSTGSAAVDVPNVVGNDPDAAQTALTLAGFQPVLAYNVDPTNASGKVAIQNPEAGSKAKKGSKVTIYVSVPGSVPDVTGMSLEQAKRVITESGYKVGNIVYTQDASVQEGAVVRTEPEQSTPLHPGESVNITVMHGGG
ncbi:MAG: putative Serine/threonine protein kinase [Candidatus Eremiobacteraeota bacterium]|nr:putative Serine/threonine protein kinase [Candidatus Eremiobacteraeota bacterium]